MARRKAQETEKLTLEVLIPRYAMNKGELDAYKKLCDADNALIKEQMKEAGLTKTTVEGYTATYITQQKETINEEQLLEIARKTALKRFIKKKEYIDFDELEKAVYKGEIERDLLLEMDKCRKKSEVVSLRITKAKQKED